jgi:tRNA modification GTPase
LRESVDAIEAEGVRRALDLVARADLVLKLRAIDSPPDRFGSIQKTLCIATKADLASDPASQVLPGEIAVSSQTGAGLDDLLASIIAELGALSQPEPALLTRERHRVAVSDAVLALERAIDARHGQVELLAEEVRLAVMALERLVGRIDVEDVLDQLFSGFCIGK